MPEAGCLRIQWQLVARMAKIFLAMARRSATGDAHGRSDPHPPKTAHKSGREFKEALLPCEYWRGSIEYNVAGYFYRSTWKILLGR